MMRLRVSHPEPPKIKRLLVPIFLPYHGCPHRCLYCAQHLQTGAGAPGLKDVLGHLEQALGYHARSGRKDIGVAFFGGTFTALPMSWQTRFLDTVRPYRQAGLVGHVRCSTRPDKIFPEQLPLLKARGLDMVELGIQSFDNTVLLATARGYDAETARQACMLVRDCGLRLGIQLMPGLPASTQAGWREDTQQACSIRPDVVRIYPCIVLAETALAQAFQSNDYHPWGLRRSVWAVGQALQNLWRHGIPVIRIGLAPEQSITTAILAGPWHPAFGFMAKSEALRMHLLRAMAGLPPGSRHIHVPRRHVSEFWGHGGAHEKPWLRQGISRSRVTIWEKPYFFIQAR